MNKKIQTDIEIKMAGYTWTWQDELVDYDDLATLHPSGLRGWISLGAVAEDDQITATMYTWGMNTEDGNFISGEEDSLADAVAELIRQNKLEDEKNSAD